MKSQFKFIGLTALLTLVPLAVLWAVFYATDPLHIIRPVDKEIEYPYFGNKGTVTVRNFERLMPEKCFDSFIFGSSLTISTDLSAWNSYLPESSVPYHFDASAMSIKQMREYMEYLAARAPLRNVYIIIDLDVIGITKGYQRSLFYTSPVVKNDLLYNFNTYFSVWQRAISASFLLNNVPIAIFRNRMDPANINPCASTDIRLYLPDTNTEINVNHTPEYEDIATRWCGSAKDSLKMYPPYYAESSINDDKKGDLRRIAEILDSAGCNYRFALITSPKREKDRPPLLNPADSAAMREIFGDHFVSAQWATLEWSFKPHATYDGYHFTSPEALRLLEFVYNDSLRQSHPGRL
ncbi:MAG: hypothetical protein K2M19_04835 [Muribaculaceae bacterium]|nr:hypothetical protein [Muribaculaceae bacterium]